MKAVKIIISGLVAFASVSPSFAQVGFVDGDQFTAFHLRGRMKMHCDFGQHTETRFVTCIRDILAPSEFSRFQAPGFQGDKVILTARHEDGSTETKKSKFNADTGLSKSEFNLWIDTLFQDPLLEVGLNRVSYELQNKGETIVRGEFPVMVDIGEERSCPHRTIFYNGDCRHTYNACTHYFRQINYCEPGL